MLVVEQLQRWLVETQPQVKHVKLLMATTPSNVQHMAIIVLYEPTELSNESVRVQWHVHFYECRDGVELMKFLANEEVEFKDRQVLHSWAPCDNIIIGTGKASLMLLSIREWMTQTEADLNHPKSSITPKRSK